MPPEHPIHVFINTQKYDLPSPTQTSMSLKALAGVPIGDALEWPDASSCSMARRTMVGLLHRRVFGFRMSRRTSALQATFSSTGT